MKKGNPILKIRNTISTFFRSVVLYVVHFLFFFSSIILQIRNLSFSQFYFLLFPIYKEQWREDNWPFKIEGDFIFSCLKKKKKAAIKLEWKKEGIKFNGLPHKNILMKKSPSFLTPAVVPLRVSDKILWHLKRTAYTKSSFLPLNYYLIIMP